ncbi:hypothetical protein ILUMI_16603, partial [Ignelater luminosus]
MKHEATYSIEDTGISDHTVQLMSYEMNDTNKSKVTITEIKDVVNAIQNKPSTGIDEVPISLVKECLEEFAMCFLLLINKSMELGQFPSQLKTALI